MSAGNGYSKELSEIYRRIDDLRARASKDPDGVVSALSSILEELRIFEMSQDKLSFVDEMPCQQRKAHLSIDKESGRLLAATQEKSEKLSALISSISDELWFADTQKKITLAENALKESEESLKLAITGADLGTWHQDLVSGEIHWNDKCKSIFGFHLDIKLSTKTILDRLHPDDRKIMEASFMRALSGQGEHKCEYRVVWPDGSIHWIESIGRIFCDESGKPVHMRGISRDITKRKKMEEDLQRSERKYRSIVERSIDGISLTDEGGRIIEWNPGMEKITGLKRGEVLDKCLWDIQFDLVANVEKSPELYGQMKAVALNALETGKSPLLGRPGEWTIQRPDGTQLVIEEVPSLIPTENGYILCSILRDITDRKSIEEALRLSEELARRRMMEIEGIYESAPIGLCVFDEHLRWQRLNSRIAEINGVPIEDHIGRTPREVVPDVGDQAEDALKHIIETGQRLDFEMSGTTLAKPGVMRFWEEHWIPMKDEQGRIVGISVAAEEITERKRMEEALKESEERLRLALDAGRMGIWDQSVPGAKMIWNDEFYRMMGYAPGEVKPGYDACAARIHPDDLPDFVAQFKRSIDKGGEFKGEFRVLWPDGTVHWVEARGWGSLDSGGHIDRIYGIALDITDYKLSKEKLHSILNAKINEKTGDLLKNYAEIEQLLYSVSRDLISPMFILKGFLDFLRKDVEDCDRLRVEIDLGLIGEVVSRMEALLKNSLEISSIGKMSLSIYEVELQQIIKDAIEILDDKIKSSRVDISMDEGLPIVCADRSRIAEVLISIINNSIRYSIQGKRLKVHIGYRIDERDVVIFVRDNGNGIDPAMHSQIFNFTNERGEYINETNSGLPLSRRIIELHGGRIWVESEIGKGCTIFFTLPEAGCTEGSMQD